MAVIIKNCDTNSVVSRVAAEAIARINDTAFPTDTKSAPSK
jgi:hypothetical protein